MKDEQADPPVKYFAGIPSADKAIAWTQDLGCPEMWHALCAEPGCEIVHAKIVSWIEERLAKPVGP